MSLVLYRKYRPQSFDQIIGQDVIVKTLQSALKQKTPAHAYLFVGSRGTGKTSVARLFAKDLGVSDKDIVEIDAASNRKIEHVRDLREMVQKLPYESMYTVYIVDEVHMMTTEAFNALLKTLEEPPKHAIFILATTEFDRVPETIRSRCQVLRFETPSYQMIAECLAFASEKEGVKASPEILNRIAMQAGGSFRDALGLLGQVIQVGGNKITEETLSMLHIGNSSGDAISCVRALVDKDFSAIKVLHGHAGSNRSALAFFESCIDLVEKGIRTRLGGVSPDELALYQPEAKDLFVYISGKPEINAPWLDTMIRYHRELSETTLPKVVLTAAAVTLIGK